MRAMHTPRLTLLLGAILGALLGGTTSCTGAAPDEGPSSATGGNASAPASTIAGTAATAPTAPHPNLLVLVTDDHPHDALGAAGHSILRTPHMDALAADGVRFTHAFVTTPICAASRASILTGRYERSHGYTFTRPALREELVAESYPVLLRDAGYRTGFVGKLGVKLPPGAREAMFDSFVSGTAPYQREGPDGAPRHLTELNVDRAIAFLDEADDRPFCLSLSFQAPHAEDSNPEQFVWPASCDELYVDDTVPAPELSDAAFFESLPAFLRSGFNRQRWSWRFDTPEKHQRMVKGYWRMLSGVDLGVGRLMRALDERGLREDTVVILIGDNGYFLGERGWAGKWTMQDRSTRVPLIVWDPRLPDAARGRTVDAFALNLDVAPTLLERAGVEIPAGVQGDSLLALLEGGAAPRREEVFTEHLWDHEHIPRTEGLRTPESKYIRYLDHPEYEELYDLRVDPLEQHNLASDPARAAELAAWRARCDRAARRAE